MTEETLELEQVEKVPERVRRVKAKDYPLARTSHLLDGLVAGMLI